ncbi:3-isopropylmalate dehydratase small subunit [Pseudoduganella sp. FT26W]|uniref:3-isopropylmalate dehydratase small subunit n=1 Tax=Duganella aquatilis TaxID=2666082 RepID=A0A844DCP9_9BURK|nr:3-isopropylmalate dehydratase small subunit [Duganella aquatilis]MRW85359.1 3-isopropylmalate dehydratase small subunit [Duganella aquatilis]
MTPFVTVEGIAAPLPAANIDTDVIMPKQFLKGIDRSGLDRGLFHDIRFDEQGQERAGFVLNQPAWHGASFLVVGDNFGCGSSREHAVWGLMQYGVRALVGTSFAGIFFDNCARNGLLAITLPAADVARLMRIAEQASTNRMTIDLPQQRIHAAGAEIQFEIDTVRKQALLQGLDAVGQTLTLRDEILAFQNQHLEAHPWFA